MAKGVNVRIDGRDVKVAEGTSVAAAMMNEGIRVFRHSPGGGGRGPLCGMGVCFECRVTIDGEADWLACQTMCAEGMEVRTQ